MIDSLKCILHMIKIKCTPKYLKKWRWHQAKSFDFDYWNNDKKVVLDDKNIRKKLNCLLSYLMGSQLPIINTHIRIFETLRYHWDKSVDFWNDNKNVHGWSLM